MRFLGRVMGHVCTTVVHARCVMCRVCPRVGPYLPRGLRFVRTRRLHRLCPALRPGYHRRTVYRGCNTMFVVNVNYGLNSKGGRSKHTPSCSSCAAGKLGSLPKLGKSLVL